MGEQKRGTHIARHPGARRTEPLLQLGLILDFTTCYGANRERQGSKTKPMGVSLVNVLPCPRSDAWGQLG